MAKLIKRKDVWTVRYFVPKELQAVARRTEISPPAGVGYGVGPSHVYANLRTRTLTRATFSPIG